MLFGRILKMVVSCVRYVYLIYAVIIKTTLANGF